MFNEVRSFDFASEVTQETSDESIPGLDHIKCLAQFVETAFEAKEKKCAELLDQNLVFVFVFLDLGAANEAVVD